MSAWPPQNQLTAFFLHQLQFMEWSCATFYLHTFRVTAPNRGLLFIKSAKFCTLDGLRRKSFHSMKAKLCTASWNIWKISWFWAGQAGRTEVFMEWLLFTDLRIARAEAYPPPKNKSNWTIISSFHLLVYIFIYLKILHLKSVSWVVFLFQFAVMWLCRQPNPRVTLIFHWN